MSPLGRYTLYQLPGWALAAAVLAALIEWFSVSAVVGVLALAALIVKDFLIYPLVGRAFEAAPHGLAQLVGEQGVAVEPLAPAGFVRVRGELWRAEALGPGSIPAGARVWVRAARGMTLLVIPDENSRAPGLTPDGVSRP